MMKVNSDVACFERLKKNIFTFFGLNLTVLINKCLFQPETVLRNAKEKTQKEKDEKKKKKKENVIKMSF